MVLRLRIYVRPDYSQKKVHPNSKKKDYKYVLDLFQEARLESYEK
jgi:hypothetical protein